jgi:hypothetical protein
MIHIIESDDDEYIVFNWIEIKEKHKSETPKDESLNIKSTLQYELEGNSSAQRYPICERIVYQHYTPIHENIQAPPKRKRSCWR